MKNVMKKVVIAVGFAALTSMVAVPNVQAATDLKVGVVNMGEVMRSSKAAKGILAELDKKRKEFQSQVGKKEENLRKSEQKIMGEKEKLSQDEFEKKRKGFLEDLEKVQKDVQVRKSTLDEAFANATTELRKEVLKVVAGIAKDKGLTAVFSQEAMVVADQSMDITNEVIKGVNKDVGNIPVVYKKK